MHFKTLLAALPTLAIWTAIPLHAAEADGAPAVAVAETTCEYLHNPLGIDVREPRFTWVLESDRRGVMQRAYRILVARSSERLAAEEGDLWDTGKVASEESVNVVYQGDQLSSRQRCFWKVRVWDDRGQASPWSAPAHFEMGLLAPSDWRGKWIGLGGEETASVSPLLRTEFVVKGPVQRARLYAAGVGWSEYYLNGNRVGDNVLDPATTDYDKRVLYVTHDVTNLVRPGANALGVMLGNGWYSPPPPDRGYGDAPRLLLELVVDLADGTVQRIVSDDAWRATTGPILKNDMWGGEIHDARREKTGWTTPGYNDSDWPTAAVRQSPGGRLEAQTIEPIKVNQVLRAVKLTEPKPGVYVYDFGQLFGGWARLRVVGPAGTRIALKNAEQIFPDTGLVDKRRHYRTVADGATDFYVLKGDPDGECYEPRFTFHPVRYVQVEGLASPPALTDLQGCVVHNAIDPTGGFECSNALLNRIHRACSWTFTNAMYGITLDCLYREHWGWLEPASTPSILFAHKHMPQFWMKFLRDVQCAQRADGVIPDVVPAYPKKNRKTGDPAWAGNYPLVTWYLYQCHGDRRLLEINYPNMKRWIDYLTSIADENHLIMKSRVKGYGNYGDHMLPGDVPGREEFLSRETPSSLLWTGFYYNNARILAQTATILGADDDAATYGRLADDIRKAMNEKWLDASRKRYATGSQSSNMFPLALGIVPEAHRQNVLNTLTDDILVRRRGHLHMGNIGTTCAIDALGHLGRADVLHRAVTSTDYPGWGYMMSHGATTIWEAWSNNLPGTSLGSGMVDRETKVGISEDSMLMFSTVNEFLFRDVAGIGGPTYYNVQPVAPGFREVRIRPRIPGDLTHAAARVRTVRGMVAVDWKRDDHGVVLKATIPANAQAKISVPKAGLRDVTVEEGGKAIWNSGAFVGGAPGITAGTDEPEYVTFDAGSGDYVFILRGNR
ncbi:MAG: family 78 glycoside hydrolase catalytic domain [Pirellulales bacterium]|nr:family 78 glycoside hydrolase catalytic domain [Pirellulales bacterium]